MKERPILFSAPMVRAILDGRKTQTRRVVKPAPADVVQLIGADDRPTGEYGLALDPEFTRVLQKTIRCPYGVPGDRLWVRESGKLLSEAFDHDPARGKDLWRDAGWQYADGSVKQLLDYDPPLSEWVDDCSAISRPSIHMPRWASRITLEITSVRVERLNDISAADADAEGFGGEFPDRVMPDVFPPRDGGWGHLSMPECYARLWEHINGPGSWAANPFVWVVEFKRVTQ